MYCSRCGTWVPAEAVACAACGMERRAMAGGSDAPPRDAHAASAVRATPATPEGVATSFRVRYGGFWRRLAAAFVDNLILYFPSAILRALAGLHSPLTLRPVDDDPFGRVMAVNVTMILVYWWYGARLESSRWQGTLGQQLLGLRVTDLQGRRVSFLRASGRFWASWLSVLLCGLGYAFNLWTSRRQTLHDLIAGCVLVRPEPEVALQAAGPAGPTREEPAS